MLLSNFPKNGPVINNQFLLHSCCITQNLILSRMKNIFQHYNNEMRSYNQLFHLYPDNLSHSSMSNFHVMVWICLLFAFNFGCTCMEQGTSIPIEIAVHIPNVIQLGQQSQSQANSRQTQQKEQMIIFPEPFIHIPQQFTIQQHVYNIPKWLHQEDESNKRAVGMFKLATQIRQPSQAKAKAKQSQSQRYSANGYETLVDDINCIQLQRFLFVIPQHSSTVFKWHPHLHFQIPQEASNNGGKQFQHLFLMEVKVFFIEDSMLLHPFSSDFNKNQYVDVSWKIEKNPKEHSKQNDSFYSLESVYARKYIILRFMDRLDANYEHNLLQYRLFKFHNKYQSKTVIQCILYSAIGNHEKTSNPTKKIKTFYSPLSTQLHSSPFRTGQKISSMNSIKELQLLLGRQKQIQHIFFQNHMVRQNSLKLSEQQHSNLLILTGIQLILIVGTVVCQTWVIARTFSQRSVI